MANVKFTGLALDINKRENKNDPAKPYHSLIMYEFGKQYPELVKINIRAEEIPTVQPLIGKKITVETELFTFKDRNSFAFRNVVS